MNELWVPTTAETREGQESYIRYLAGVAILREPDSDFASSFHQLDVGEASLESILISAEELMYLGARKVIFFSNPEGHRSSAAMEKNYEGALPIMRRIVDSTFEELGVRVRALGLAYPILRPAAFTDKTIYTYILHPHRDKLQTRRLMGNLPPAAIFDSMLVDRTLGHLTHSVVG